MAVAFIRIIGVVTVMTYSYYVIMAVTFIRIIGAVTAMTANIVITTSITTMSSQVKMKHDITLKTINAISTITYRQDNKIHFDHSNITIIIAIKRNKVLRVLT